jgi:hypothetical protein
MSHEIGPVDKFLVDLIISLPVLTFLKLSPAYLLKSFGVVV